MQTVRTDELVNDEIWEEMTRLRGSACENPKLHQCPFFQKRAKVHSQNGEEGVLLAIFEKIGYTNRKCAEMGADDGVSISNTLVFKERHGFERTLLEGNINTIANKRTDEEITLALISSQNINSLLSHLPHNFDLLSLDLDGDDFYIFKAMEKRPRVVILEYHPGIDNKIPVAIPEFQGDVNSHRFEKGTNIDGLFSAYYGANLLAFYRLAKKKGYEFVTGLSDNAVFVLKEEFPKLGIAPIDEKTCIDNYFSPSEYWGVTNRDTRNRLWVVQGDLE